MTGRFELSDKQKARKEKRKERNAYLGAQTETLDELYRQINEININLGVPAEPLVPKKKKIHEKYQKTPTRKKIALPGGGKRQSTVSLREYMTVQGTIDPELSLVDAPVKTVGAEQAVYECEPILVAEAQAVFKRSNAIEKVRERLPIYYDESDIVSLIKKNQIVCINGSTGCGKTTQIPQFILERINPKLKVLISQPRRVSAVAIAMRVRKELNDNICHHSVRFDNKICKRTRVAVVTDGMLLREIQKDPLLSEYGVVIIDEVHMRTLQTEIAIPLLKRMLGSRKDMRLMFMSATMETDLLNNYFQTVIPTHYITVENRPVSVLYEHKIPTDYLRLCKERILDSIRKDSTANILVFLPIYSDISRLQLTLRKCCNATVLPLHANLTEAEQDAVFQKYSGAKVILSTNVAETSLTIPDVNVVIDSGLVKNVYVDESHLSYYKIEYTSKNSAEQRKGRTGRNCDGICYRLYPKRVFDALNEFEVASIHKSNIDYFILYLIRLDLGDIYSFPFLESIPVDRIRRSIKYLTSLDAIKDYRITEKGVRVTQYPLEVHMGSFVADFETGLWPEFDSVPRYLIYLLVSYLSLKDNDLTYPFKTFRSKPLSGLLTNLQEDSPMLRGLFKAVGSFRAKNMHVPETSVIVGDIYLHSEDLKKCILYMFCRNLVLCEGGKFYYGTREVFPADNTSFESSLLVFERLLIRENGKYVFQGCTEIDEEWVK